LTFEKADEKVERHTKPEIARTWQAAQDRCLKKDAYSSRPNPKSVPRNARWQ
jgi:hypothetical protein